MSETRQVTAVAIVPFALALHNAEEALTMSAALPQLEATWSQMLGRSIALPSAHQYALALWAVTSVAFALLILAWKWTPASYALVVVQAVMTINVATHLLGAIILRGYAPGLITAIVVEAPTSALVFHRLRRGAWMSRAQWRLLPLLAVLVHGPALVALLTWVRTQ